MASIGGGAPPVRQIAARCDIDGLVKMPLQASIFTSWFNRLGILPWAKSGRLCRFMHFRVAVQFDGRAEMPLQASISASWYNIPTNSPYGKYRRRAAACNDQILNTIYFAFPYAVYAVFCGAARREVPRPFKVRSNTGAEKNSEV